MAGISAVVVVAFALALLGIPPSLRADIRTNLALACGWTGLLVCWVIALAPTRGSPVRASVWLAVGAALCGALGNWALVLGGLGWIPADAVFRSVALIALEAPLWAMALLLWPTRPGTRGNSWTIRSLDIATLLLAVGILGWDFLIRPAGGFPTRTYARLAAASWLLVLLSVGIGALRGAKAERPVPFGLLIGGLGLSVAGNYLFSVVVPSFDRLVLVSGMLALLLRLGAAGAMGTGARLRQVGNLSPGRPGTTWVAVATMVLLSLHLGVNPPGEGSRLIAGGILGLGLLVAVRWFLDRASAEPGEPASPNPSA